MTTTRNEVKKDASRPKPHHHSLLLLAGLTVAITSLAAFPLLLSPQQQQSAMAQSAKEFTPHFNIVQDGESCGTELKCSAKEFSPGIQHLPTDPVIPPNPINPGASEFSPGLLKKSSIPPPDCDDDDTHDTCI